ncbi:hypothetical protein F5Y15DRAFT_411550 [Xylariaceae sp. FL0016]|nr:hypothetical protein F5Y15DRAFT_411550 [Xylariaceae sp. FL0016]
MVTTRSGPKTATGTTTGPVLWTHAPSPATLFWLAVSLPLVVWDSGYVLLRPHTMEGGRLHWPLWAPYKLYGEVDHVYGWKAFNAGNGFTSAQGFLNVIETAMYLAYLAIYFRAGVARSGGSGGSNNIKRVLTGRSAGWAVILAFSAAVMTLSKTVLYWLNEYFSGYDNIGHNSLQDLIFLWIIPNGAWLVFPTYMIYIMGIEIVDGLASASTGTSVKTE